MIARALLLCSLLLCPTFLPAQTPFWDQAVALLNDGQFEQAATLAQEVLAANPADPDALVISGTVVLYQKMQLRRDDSIFQPDVDATAEGELRLTPEAADAVAATWKRVPALDPSRGYLWGDLAQLTFRSGDTARALEYATAALNDPSGDAEALRAAASVFALNLDWSRAALALSKIPGERTALLYQGLEAWRTGKDGWRTPLKAFADNPGPQRAGAELAAYLAGPAMRDTEVGYLDVLKVEDGIAGLAVRQKYVERYPDKFQPRLDLARSLSQHGSFVKALFHYSEIDRKGIASTPEQRLSVLFQEAWAHQGAGHRTEAVRLWGMLADTRDFYLRSAACWFLGQDAQREGKLPEAKEWWNKVAAEPARSKYAGWSAQALKKAP